MRARLCMKPVARQLAHARVDQRNTRASLLPARGRRGRRDASARAAAASARARPAGYAASSWAKKSRHASSRVHTRTPSRSAGSRDSAERARRTASAPERAAPAQMRRQPRRGVERRADRGSRDSGRRRRAGTRRAGAGSVLARGRQLDARPARSGTVDADAVERAAPPPSRAASAPPPARRAPPTRAHTRCTPVRAPARWERSRRLHERRLGRAHVTPSRSSARATRASRARAAGSWFRACVTTPAPSGAARRGSSTAGSPSTTTQSRAERAQAGVERAEAGVHERDAPVRRARAARVARDSARRRPRPARQRPAAASAALSCRRRSLVNQCSAAAITAREQTPAVEPSFKAARRRQGSAIPYHPYDGDRRTDPGAPAGRARRRHRRARRGPAARAPLPARRRARARPSRPTSTTPEEAFRTWERGGVPQFRHSHAFLARLRLVLLAHLPDVLDRLRAARRARDRARRHGAARDGVPAGADDEDVVLLACRRATFEWALRASVQRAPERRAARGRQRDAASSASARDGGRPRVRGVRLADGSELAAALVVDALRPALARAGVARGARRARAARAQRGHRHLLLHALLPAAPRAARRAARPASSPAISAG